ncbi:MAG: hypothetical protein K9H06_08640, partial [Melioribacteraceae bacterium]|nr:hypothetical protein [Melioribacteraceae bacterium]
MKNILSIKISKFYNALKNFFEKNTGKPKNILPMDRSIQLDNYSCAVHASNSILKILDKHPELDIIFSELGTTEEDGTDTGPILQLFENMNISYEINENAGIGD